MKAFLFSHDALLAILALLSTIGFFTMMAIGLFVVPFLKWKERNERSAGS